MKKFLILLLFPLIVAANPIDEKCPNNVIWGAPKVSNENTTQYLCRINYAVNYNYKTKVANYVVEHINPKQLIKKSSRKNDFREDTEIPVKYRSTLDDYSGSGYDRGHMAPAGDFVYDSVAMSESFLLSNMMPQNQNNNRGIWKVLEDHVRDLSVIHNVYIITGTIFNPGYKIIGNGVGVPDEIYKIVIVPDMKKIFAFLFPNKTINSINLSKYIVPVYIIEQKSGINFSPLIPENLKQLELTINKR